MKPTKMKIAVMSVLAANTCLVTQQSIAQPALEEIVVTAQFREENVQDTPIAITAITGDMLEARSQTNVFQIANQAPNVSLQPGGPARSGMIAFIRGIGQVDFDAAVEPGVGMYVDDVYYAQMTGSLLDLLDVDRVEVLRGPQGTLSGRNSIGGAIKLYSKKPGTDGTGGNVKVSYGSFNQTDVRGSADFEILPDTLYARIAGASRARDGYVDDLDYACVVPDSGLLSYGSGRNCLIEKHGDQNYTTGRVNLRWIASDDVEVNIIGDYLNDSSGTAAGTLLWGDRTAIETATTPDGTLINPSIIGDDNNPDTPPVYYRDHIFVPYGKYRNPNLPINDPYVNFTTRRDTNTAMIVGAGDPPPRVPAPWKPLDMPSRNALNHYGLSMQLDWDINQDLSLTSITAYRSFKKWMTWDSDYSPLAVTMLDNYLRHRQLTQELRLSSSTESMDWTVGAYYLRQFSSYEARVTLPYALLDFKHGPDPVPAKTWAAFGNATWHLNNRWDLTAGVRYSDEAKDYTHHRHNPDGSPVSADIPGNNPAVDPLFFANIRVSGVNGLTAKFRDTVTDWRVALNYYLNDEVMLYGSVSTGYKSGGVNARPFFPVQLETFNPETLTAYEVGFKSTLLDNSLRLNAAAFYNEYDDIQLLLNECEVPEFINPSGFGAPCAKPANVGSAEIKGVEAEAEWYLGDNLLIDASLSALDFQYTHVDPVALTGSSIAPLDMITPYTPELKYSLGIQYNWGGGSRGDWHVRLDTNYQDDVYTNPTNAPTNLLDGYALYNARLWWESRDGDWRVAGELLNFTDKLYYYTKFDQANSVGQVTGQPGLPRTWQLSATRQF